MHAYAKKVCQRRVDFTDASMMMDPLWGTHHGEADQLCFSKPSKPSS